MATLNERIYTLKHHGFTDESIAAVLNIDGADVDATLLDPQHVIDVPVVEPVTFGETTASRTAPSFDQLTAELADIEAASVQASDPTKAALCTWSGRIDLQYTPEQGSQAAVVAVAYPAKPLEDNVGDMVQFEGLEFSAGTNTADEIGMLTVPFSTTFVLPVGWWAALQFTNENTDGVVSIAGEKFQDTPFG